MFRKTASVCEALNVLLPGTFVDICEEAKRQPVTTSKMSQIMEMTEEMLQVSNRYFRYSRGIYLAFVGRGNMVFLESIDLAENKKLRLRYEDTFLSYDGDIPEVDPGLFVTLLKRKEFTKKGRH